MGGIVQTSSKLIAFTMHWLYTFSLYASILYKAILSLHSLLYVCYGIVTKDLPNTSFTIPNMTSLKKHFFPYQFHELNFHTPPLHLNHPKVSGVFSSYIQYISCSWSHVPFLLVTRDVRVKLTAKN